SRRGTRGRVSPRCGTASPSAGASGSRAWGETGAPHFPDLEHFHLMWIASFSVDVPTGRHVFAAHCACLKATLARERAPLIVAEQAPLPVAPSPAWAREAGGIGRLCKK